ncbi:carboxypeptidase-like regulatory domain-containing protein [Flavobacterium sp. PL002]|uniref:carboxypeptidase-like regulatory domain-containing protein n=1 Tax=Flavobacterium sp. PL002 TaxID=1897058 RepID=UPI0017889408|nr:carboxypeptidase-like regulatory domain-containing protein [Flavobacterium sp. PL002]MBE0392800.1 hypothetical protein [Flavobacterium sp. PL002]
MVKLGFVFFMLLTANAFSQEVGYGVVKGNVSDVNINVGGVYVINTNTEEATITNEDGDFTIKAALGETLLFSAMQYKSVRVVLTDEAFSNGLLYVKMNPIMNQLNEVIIRTYNNINAVALGIVPAGQRTYTPAERRLKGATSLDPTASASPSLMAGGSISADPIFNLISGRSAMLKKELANEKKEIFMAMLDRMFDQNHYTNKLHIPTAYVKGFLYYAVENDKFTKVLKTKNITTIEFLLSELATKYKVIIANQEK